MGYSIGDKFGKLTIVGFRSDLAPSGRKRNFAICRCDCGETHECERYNLKTGNTVHCKKCASRHKSEHRRKHGHSENAKNRTKIEAKSYYTWCAMKRRCSRPRDKAYPRYGGRGISVCQRWMTSYENFLADMGLPPSMDHQIDRIDNDGNYEPSNCRWVTRVENAGNKGNNRVIECFGRRMILADWAKETGIKRETIARRLERGWDVERALTK